MFTFFIKLSCIILGVYLILAALFFFLSDFFLFHVIPGKNPSTLNAFKLTTPLQDEISISYLEVPHAKFTILFSHGNGENLSQSAELIESIRAHGYSVLAYDYPGYGESIGVQTEQHINAAMLTAYHFLINEKQIKPQHIILMGRSLGSGPSIELATHYPVGGIIIEGGFTSAYRVYSRYPIFPFDKFNNAQKLSKIHLPILIIHGTLDKTVPFYQGLQLYKVANEPKYFLWVEGAGHNNVRQIAKEKYWDAIKKRF